MFNHTDLCTRMLQIKLLVYGYVDFLVSIAKILSENVAI